MNPLNRRIVILAFLLASLAASAANAPTLTLKFTEVSIPGALATTVSGVNNAGVMVGQYQDGNGVWHGYILKGKKVTTIDDPDGTDPEPFGLNLNGALAVVGSYRSTASGKPMGFLYKNGKFTDIPGPKNSLFTYAAGVNDSGKIVGTYFDSTSRADHGFLLSGKKYKLLKVPGATTEIPTSINNQGSVVLYWLGTNDIQQSSFYNGKSYRKINVPGAPQSQAQSLNNEDDISYYWIDANDGYHGALRVAGKFYKFNYPKSAYTYPIGLNDHRVVVGAYRTEFDSPFHGFKATY